MMKTWVSSICLSISTLLHAQQAEALREAVKVAENIGPHHQEYVVKDEAGNELSRYTQLATGLNYFSAAANAWLPADPSFQIVEDGAAASKTQHKVFLAGNANNPNGTIHITLPSGNQLKMQCVGVALSDGENSIFLGEIQSSNGVLIEPNKVIYPDCFDLIQASLMVQNTINGVEFDVILLERIDRDLIAALSNASGIPIDPDHAVFEIWHQVLQSPVTLTHQKQFKRKDGRMDTDNDIWADQMMFIPGKAFHLSEPTADQVPVSKQWATLMEQNTPFTFLVERVPFVEIEAQLDGLPQAAVPKIDKEAVQKAWTAKKKGERSRPISLANKGKATGSNAFVAGVDPKWHQNGYLFDYALSGTLTNFTFRADTTYHVAANTSVTLHGNTIIEGGSVVKFGAYGSNKPVINVWGTLDCQTEPLNPAIFTSMDDDTVGSVISGSSGVPGWNAFAALDFSWTSAGTVTVKDLIIRHAIRGLYFERRGVNTMRNVQISNSKYGVDTYHTDVLIQNALLYDNQWAISAENANNTTIKGEQVTIDKAQLMFYSKTNNNSLYLTNSLAFSISSNSSPTVAVNTANLVFSTSSYSFNGQGGALHYLPSDSIYRAAGTREINTNTLAAIGKGTTTAPIILSSAINVDTVLGRSLPPNSYLPDLGYYYPSVDYVASGVQVNNATLTLTNGVRLGVYGPVGVSLTNNANLVSHGRPEQMNVITRFTSFHEKATNWGSAGTNIALIETQSDGVQVNGRFTKFNLSANDDGKRRLLDQKHQMASFSLRDSYVSGAFQNIQALGASPAMTLALTNNLIHDSYFNISQTNGGSTNALYLYLRNNTFEGSAIHLKYHNTGYGWEARDNFFNSCTLTNFTSNNLSSSHNGYYFTTHPLPGETNSVTLTSLNYQSGPLGNRYYPTSGAGSLFSLVNTGSRNVTNSTLSHFTVRTDNSKDSSTVDVGFHYVAMGSEGVPLDQDLDTLPDYLEDRNGNGAGDSGETGWLTEYNSPGGLNGLTGLQTFTPLK